MYISKLRIKNFRAFDLVELNFNEGLNILIGENNSGKSAIIDALRLCLGYGKPDSGIYIQESDIYRNHNDPKEVHNEIQFDLIFEIGEDPFERQCFNDFISQDPDDAKRQTIQLHIRYSLENKGKRKFFKRTVWGGDNEGQLIPYDALHEIFYTYLSPMRDAVNSLKPYSYDNKTAQLFNQLTKYNKEEEQDIKLDDKKKSELASKLHDVFEDEKNDWKYILESGKEKVNDHLEGTGINKKSPQINMNYVGRKYSDVVRGIELKRPIYNPEELNGAEQEFFELYQNGLGENNLIYTSVVLGDLINRCEDEDLEIYNALLVEEPEAHLHPQYQNTFFEYLNTLQDKGLQIFVTSHSPTITAKCKLDRIFVLQKQLQNTHIFSFANLSEEDFSSTNRSYLLKFLDTTKSQMFFANAVVLVEGIAEVILLPILSKKFSNDKIDLEKNGVEIINVAGVAFEHFAKLYNNADEKKRLLAKCSLITDSDPVLAKAAMEGEPETPAKPISDRAAKANELTKHNLHVSLAPNTFEFDMFCQSDNNRSIMQRVYRSMHPGTFDLEGDFSVEILMKKLKSNKDKADFALALNEELDGCDRFEVPEYIQEAIDFLSLI